MFELEIKEIKEDWSNFIKGLRINHFYLSNQKEGMVDIMDVCSYGLDREKNDIIKDMNNLISYINWSYIQVFKGNSEKTEDINIKFKEVSSKVNNLKLKIK
jgi:hypothetical protein